MTTIKTKGKSKMSKVNKQNEWIKHLTKEQLLDKTEFIIQPIYSYENEDGSKVYDVEEMQREFDYELNKLESEVG